MNKVLLILVGAALAFPLTVAAQGDNEANDAPVAVAERAAVNDEPGILVAGVVEDSPAEAAGILRGDVILEVAGEKVDTIADLQTILSDQRAGDTVEVLLSRGGDEMTVQVTLETRLYRPVFGIEATPRSRGVPYARIQPSTRGSSVASDATTSPTPMGNGPMMRRGSVADVPGVGGGDIVMEVAEGSPAEAAGIATGDIIVQVGETALEETNLADAVAEHAPGDVVDIRLARRGDEGFETVTVTATLGENDEGDTYLGVSFVPLGARFRDVENMAERFRDDMRGRGLRGPGTSESQEDNDNDNGSVEDDDATSEPMSL